MEPIKVPINGKMATQKSSSNHGDTIHKEYQLSHDPSNLPYGHLGFRCAILQTEQKFSYSN